MPSRVTPAPRRRPRVLTAVAALVVILAGAALAGVALGHDGSRSTSSSRPTSAVASAVVDVTTAREALADGAVLIDVRTPEEYAAGHLAGAANIDLGADDFDQRIAALDPEADHVLYCASGRRAGEAIAVMEEAGFTGRLVNGGGYDDLADAGLGTADGGGTRPRR